MIVLNYTQGSESAAGGIHDFPWAAAEHMLSWDGVDFTILTCISKYKGQWSMVTVVA